MNDADKAETRKFPRLPLVGEHTIAFAVVATVLLVLLTIAVSTFIPRHSLDDRSVLTNADFAEGFSGWMIDGLITLHESEPGRIVLHNRDPARSAYLRRTLELPPGGRHVRLSAEVAADRVRPGAEPWQTARIYLVQEASDGTYQWEKTRHLVNLAGTTARETISAVFEVPDAVPAVVLGIELSQATGRLDVGKLQAQLVEESILFRLVASLLVGAWSLLAFWVVTQLYGAIRSTIVRTGLVAAIGLLGACLLTPMLIPMLLAPFGLGFLDSHIAGQALAFALLAYLVRLGHSHSPWWQHLLCWLLVVAATEALAMLSSGGVPNLVGWFAGAFGASLGLTLAEASRKLWLWAALAPPRQADPDRGES